MLLEMLESMNGVRWIIVGVVLLIFEVLTGTMYILWPAIAALLVGVVAFVLPVFGWEAQFIMFFLLSIALLIVGHTHFRPKMKGGEPSDLNDRARAMVGERVRAVADFETGQGRVQFGDTQWRATINHGDVKAGDELVIIDVDGTTLAVRAK